MLPPSDIDPDDFPPGPNGMARYLDARIDELEGQKRDAQDRQERRPINQQLHECRGLLRWCQSRAGYKADPTPADLGLLDAGEVPDW